MKNILISIIVPIYNSSKTLDMCINSLLTQSYSNLEILLINDGSIDDSEEICKKCVELDKRCKYFYKDNGGLSDARNYGLNKISGDYVMFLDSDDCFSKYCTETMVKIVDFCNPDIISFNFTYNFDKLEQMEIFEFNKNSIISENILTEYFMKEVAVTNRCFKKSIIEDIEFIKNQISEDVIYLFKCYERALKIYKSNFLFYYYNKTGFGITRSGLSIKDNTSVEANEFVVNECLNNHREYIHHSKMQYCKSIFNLINKSVLRGYSNEESQMFYKHKMKEYCFCLRKNLLSILCSKQFSCNDKIQIFILSFSRNIFKFVKKLIMRGKNETLIQ